MSEIITAEKNKHTDMWMSIKRNLENNEVVYNSSCYGLWFKDEKTAILSAKKGFKPQFKVVLTYYSGKEFDTFIPGLSDFKPMYFDNYIDAVSFIVNSSDGEYIIQEVFSN